MSDKVENPPAFPQLDNSLPIDQRNGMTLRDYFAAQVIGPLMASDGFEKLMFKVSKKFTIEDLPAFSAKVAYEIADALLQERTNPK